MYRCRSAECIHSWLVLRRTHVLQCDQLSCSGGQLATWSLPPRVAPTRKRHPKGDQAVAGKILLNKPTTNNNTSQLQNSSQYFQPAWIQCGCHHSRLPGVLAFQALSALFAQKMALIADLCYVLFHGLMSLHAWAYFDCSFKAWNTGNAKSC